MESPHLSTSTFWQGRCGLGGVFIILSLLWGWKIDNITPDKFDVIGGLIASSGVFVIMYWPRA